ncbi:MAG: hypothetical protein U0797_27580 [Gemmataceae bacterium]
MLTSATEVSLEVNTVSRVTSRTEPSENFASTDSCWKRPGASCTREPGSTSTPVRAGSFGSSSRSPSASQARTAWAGRAVGWNRWPPSCGTRPSPLSSMRLSSGRCRSVRRPSTSRVNWT